MLLYLGNWGYFHFTLPQGLDIVGAWAPDSAPAPVVPAPAPSAAVPPAAPRPRSPPTVRLDPRAYYEPPSQTTTRSGRVSRPLPRADAWRPGG